MYVYAYMSAYSHIHVDLCIARKNTTGNCCWVHASGIWGFEISGFERSSGVRLELAVEKLGMRAKVLLRLALNKWCFGCRLFSVRMSSRHAGLARPKGRKQKQPPARVEASGLGFRGPPL